MNICLNLILQISILLEKLFIKSGNNKIAKKISKVMNRLIMKKTLMKRMMKFIKTKQIRLAETNFITI